MFLPLLPQSAADGSQEERVSGVKKQPDKGLQRWWAGARAKKMLRHICFLHDDAKSQDESFEQPIDPVSIDHPGKKGSKVHTGSR